MDANNLAIVFAPNLLRPPGNEVSSILVITDMGHLIELVTTMIIDVDTLFIRQSLAEERTRAFKKAMQKKYSNHSIVSLSALENVKKGEERNSSTSEPCWNYKISFLKTKLQSGDSRTANTFFDHEEIKLSPRRIHRHIRQENHRRKIDTVFKELSDNIAPELETRKNHKELTITLISGDDSESKTGEEVVLLPETVKDEDVKSMLDKIFTERDENEDEAAQSTQLTTLLRRLTLAEVNMNEFESRLDSF